ncbi:MAG TPA: cbb3-type cytochrome c oxidase subunit II [Acidimicrobiia bacterium]|nr:cbb3-type cytochrome c oxidase subunit II [Acidimicrobiia bacterium]
MSDLGAAAAALGLPEALVERSAAARAAETGASVDDILAQWAGGEAAPAPAAAEPEPTSSAAEDETPTETTAAATPEVVIEVPGESTQPAAPAPAPAGPYQPPVLVGAKDNPINVVAGVVGLFVIVVLTGLVGPSMPVEIQGARSSDLVYSEAALRGQEVFLVTGCAACHSQMVRPVVADVGLGPVTLNDTNQALGTRRFGPDLSDVGSRVTAGQIEAIIGGLGDHPAQSLGEADLGDLVAYLSESATSSPDADEGLPEGGEEGTP